MHRGLTIENVDKIALLSATSILNANAWSRVLQNTLKMNNVENLVLPLEPVVQIVQIGAIFQALEMVNNNSNNNRLQLVVSGHSADAEADAHDKKR